MQQLKTADGRMYQARKKLQDLQVVSPPHTHERALTKRAVLSHKMYQFNGFGKSTLPQNW